MSEDLPGHDEKKEGEMRTRVKSRLTVVASIRLDVLLENEEGE